MRLLPLLLLFWVAPTVFSDPAWRALALPEDRVASAHEALNAATIPWLDASNAVVEVSAFEGLEFVTVGELPQRLTTLDPRWDPWLRETLRWFTASGHVPVWVPAADWSRAQALVGGKAQAPRASGVVPPIITGWTVIVISLFWLVFVVSAGALSSWDGWAGPRRWIQTGFATVALVAGAVLVAGPAGASPGQAPVATASWLQHRWFQQAWPWGATWDDYAPDRAWTFRSYERKDGKLTEVDAQLTAADQTWVDEAWTSLDAHHALRIFGSDHP